MRFLASTNAPVPRSPTPGGQLPGGRARQIWPKRQHGPRRMTRVTDRRFQWLPGPKRYPGGPQAKAPCPSLTAPICQATTEISLGHLPYPRPPLPRPLLPLGEGARGVGPGAAGTGTNRWPMQSWPDVASELWTTTQVLATGFACHLGPRRYPDGISPIGIVRSR